MNSSGPPPLPVKPGKRGAVSKARPVPQQKPGTWSLIGLGFAITLVAGLAVGLLTTIGLYATGRLSMEPEVAVVDSTEEAPQTPSVEASPSRDGRLGEQGGASESSQAPTNQEITTKVSNSELESDSSTSPASSSEDDSDKAAENVGGSGEAASAPEDTTRASSAVAVADASQGEKSAADKTTEQTSQSKGASSASLAAIQDHPILVLPELDSRDSEGEVRLVQLPKESVSESLECQLLGIQEVFGDQPASFERLSGSDQKVWEFRVGEEGKQDVDRPIAKFLIRDDGLYFQWLSSARNEDSAELLRWCLIRVSSGKQSKTSRLGAALTRKPAEIDVLTRNLKVPVFEDPRSSPPLPRTENLKIQLIFDSKQKQTIELDEMATFTISLKQQEDPEPAIELEATFEKSSSSMLFVSSECYAYPERINADIEETGPLLVDRSVIAETKKKRTRKKRTTELEKKQKEGRANEFSRIATNAIRAGRTDLATNADSSRQELEAEIEELDADLELLKLSQEWEEELLSESKRWKTSKKLELNLFFEIQGQSVEILTTRQK